MQFDGGAFVDIILKHIPQDAWWLEEHTEKPNILFTMTTLSAEGPRDMAIMLECSRDKSNSFIYEIRI
mgnify:CR=1 FL=1